MHFIVVLVALAAPPKALSEVELASLKELPEVAAIERVGQQATYGQVIQVNDWHLVTFESFAADLRDEHPSISEREIDVAYQQHLKDVDTVQQEQMAVLSRLIKQHSLREVYIEGLTAEDVIVFEAMLRVLKKSDGQDRQLLLRVGAAGRLVLTGKLERVLPAEDRNALEKSQPIDAEGKVELEKALSKARHDAIAKLVVEPGELRVLVIGARHNLRESIPDSIGYYRITTKATKTLLND